MHIVGAQETLEKRKKGRGGWEEEEYSLSIGGLTLIFLSSVFFSPLPEEINEECDLLKEALLSELTYVQLKLS